MVEAFFLNLSHKQTFSKMKKTAILLISILSLIGLSASAQNTVSLMTHNIRHGEPLKGLRDAKRNAAIINRYKPDIAAFQEVDSMTERCHDYILDDIAKLTDMTPVFVASMDFAGGKYGNGILCRESPLKVTRQALPGSEEPRSILIIEFEKYVAACTHLSLNADDRIASAKLINEISAQTSKPFFIMGDFNDQPQSEFHKLISKKFTTLNAIDAFTFPADEPDCTIDYIMLDNKHAASATVSLREVIEEPEVSDHRPVIVKISVPDNE